MLPMAMLEKPAATAAELCVIDPSSAS